MSSKFVRRAFASGWGLVLLAATEMAAASSGTGIVVSPQGHILTNAHVVKGCQTATVRLAGTASNPASIVARSEADDLALLLASPTTQKVASFRISPPVRAGEAVVVYGFPLSGLLTSTGNATTGNVSALAGLRNNSAHLQTSAPVQPGNSGGPLLDNKGNVIGVVVSKLDALRFAKLTEDIPQNINFAIKASVAANFLDAQGAPYLIDNATEELPVPDIVERAKAFTVEVQCKATEVAAVPDTTPQKAAKPAPSPNKESIYERGRLFAHVLHRSLAEDNVKYLNMMGYLYGVKVRYFGEDLSKAEVMVRLDRFAKRWPYRNYRAQDPITTICDEAAMQCTVKGRLQFDARSAARSQRSYGTAEFSYLLQYLPNRTAPIIIAEDGKVIDRQVVALPQ